MAVELALQVFAVLLGGAETHAERLGDLLVALAQSQQLEHLALARSERLHLARADLHRVRAAARAADEHARHLGREVHLAAVHRLDRQRQFGRIGILREVAVGAGLQRLLHEALALVVREHHNARARMDLADLRDRVDAGEAGHRDVEQHHIGQGLPDRGDGRTWIAGISGHREAGILDQHALEACADHRLVVD